MASLRPLYTRQRRALLRYSALICVGSIVLGASTMRLSFQAQAEEQPPIARHSVPQPLPTLTFPSILIKHDPFIPSTIDGLASNDRSFNGMADAATSSVPLVRAIVVGTSPRALVEIAGAPQVVGIGSALAASIVTSIDAAGVQLQTGQILPLAGKLP